jgi:hypothetical protein
LTSICLFLFSELPLLSIAFLLFRSAFSIDFLPTSLLLGLHEFLRFSSSALEVPFALASYLFPPRLIIGGHSCKAFLGVKVVEMFLLGRRKGYLYVLFMRDTILLLLSVVIFSKERCLFLPIRALKVINSFVKNPKAFTEIALLLIKLFDLQAD